MSVQPATSMLRLRHCSDVTLLVNNAGAMLNTPILSPDGVDAMLKETEVKTAVCVHALVEICARGEQR
jgi:short-subunit dehydrogenase